ncbi:MAG: hypothetical protein FWB80_03875 [Defluviitaleaceae bacterium]|nr:hypothetical protein [Defluviitaleaceae bacterium]
MQVNVRLLGYAFRIIPTAALLNLCRKGQMDEMTVQTLKKDGIKKMWAVAAEAIFATSELSRGATAWAELFQISGLHPSLGNNLKDAIVHFRKLDSSYQKINYLQIDDINDDNISALTQFELLSEHLTRGIIDTYVDLLQRAGCFYDTMMRCVQYDIKNGRLTNGDDIFHMMRKAMHLCRNEILSLRRDKFNLFRLANWKTSDETLSVDSSFLFRVRIIHKSINQTYTDVYNRFDSSNLLEMYHTVLKSCRHNGRLYPVQRGDNLQKIADNVNCDIAKLQVLNDINLAYNVNFDERFRWIVCPK